MILAIETAVEQVGVALADHRGVIAQASVSSDRQHAESLAPMIQFVLAQCGARMNDVSALAVDIGPGLFTGMRVGIATAQSLAWALDVPVAPICSLDALAVNAGRSGLSADDPVADEIVATALDARRGEVYWCLHRVRATGSGLVRFTEPVVSAPDDLAIHLADRAEPVLCIGTGFERHRETFESLAYARLADPALRFPTAPAVALLAQPMVAADQAVAPDAVVPLYLRPPDAEIHWTTRGVAS